MARRNQRSTGAESSAGFGISFYDQSTIEDNVRERFGPEYGEPDDRRRARRAGFVNADGEVTTKGWDRLAKDIDRIEDNSLAWMRRTFLRVRDEGHDVHDDLVGVVWFNPRDPEQAWLIDLASPSPGRSERIDMVDASYGDLANTAFDGVSDFGVSVLGGQITFYDVSPEDWEIIEETLED